MVKKFALFSMVFLLFAACGEAPRVTKFDRYDSVEGRELVKRQADLEATGLRISVVNGTYSFDAYYDREFSLEHPFLSHEDRTRALSAYKASVDAMANHFGATSDLVAKGSLVSERMSLEEKLRGNVDGKKLSLELALVKDMRNTLQEKGLIFHVNLGSGRLTLEGAENNYGVLLNAYISALEVFVANYSSQLVSERLSKELEYLRRVFRHAHL